MRMIGIISFLAAAAASPAGAVTVEAANGDWSTLPQLSQRGYQHLSEKMQAKLYEIASSQQCNSFVPTQGRLDLKMTFAVQYAPDGSLSRVVLPQLNCPEAEGVAGGMLLEMVQAGDYAATGKSANGWYQGTLGFTFAGDRATEPSVAILNHKQAPTTKMGSVTGTDPNEVLCEKVEEIGTRLVANRTCMSRAKWAEQKRLSRDVIERIQVQRGCKDVC